MKLFPIFPAAVGMALLGISAGIGALPAQAQVNCEALLRELYHLGGGQENQTRALAIQNQYNANCWVNGMAVPAQRFGTGPGPEATGVIGAIIGMMTSSPDVQGIITQRDLYPGVPEVNVPYVIPSSNLPQYQAGVPMREIPVIDPSTGATVGVVREPATSGALPDPSVLRGPVGQIEAPPPGFYNGGSKPDFYQERD